MLKIKGLKKKKKVKKSKHKEEELFEAAELEEYRKEQQRKQEELREKGGETQEQDEEWQKFKLLTSGVDDILKKTQGDLDRIKSTSFFQKKSPAPSSDPAKEAEKKPDKPERPREPAEKKWVGFEEGDSSLTVEVAEDVPQVTAAESGEQEFKPDGFTEEEEEESEEEDDLDDLFDTSYVDAVESGEVILAYIPESPTQEDDSGYDPFDTSIVDKVISVKDQKKALVTLGSAVEVLSGKADKPVAGQEASPFKTSKRRRPRPQDLLLGSFDEVQPSTSPVPVTVEPAPKSILDDDPFFEEQTSETLGFAPVTPIAEATTPLAVQQPKKRESVIDIKNLVDEFVTPVTPSVDLQILQLTEPANDTDEFDDEFAALAVQSISKEKEVTESKPPPRPAPPPPAQKPITDTNDLEDDEDDLADDPFDTTFADKVLPGKYELKIIEKEVLHDHIQVDATNIVQNKINQVLKNTDLTIKLPKAKFQETFEDDDFKLLTPSQRDLLGGSTTDLSSIGPNPIQPESASANTDDVIHYSDPFDTSVIDSLVAPKKTELKYLEQELLVDPNKTIGAAQIDDDFDPRAGESRIPSRPHSLVVAPGKRISVPKIVAFDVRNENEQDLLAVDQEELSKIGKPLTPYYTDKNIIQDKLTSESDADPFDTSFVNHAPGKVELKLLENELVGTTVAGVDLSDPDFDPRAQEEIGPALPAVEEAKEELRPDIISEDVSTDIKLHTPVVPRKIQEDLKPQEDIDPFDTSIVSNLAPGKAEIKFLEKELIESGTVLLQPSDNSSQVVKNLLEKAKKQSFSSDTDLLAQAHDDDSAKPLTPIPADFSIEDEDYDPFDTSAVANILPGKTEIKILESQLLN